MKNAAALEIVWRNRKPLQRRRRWEQVDHDSAATHYLVQELVSSPIGSFWRTTSNLEFISGGRAA
jgi:hypothetical protein